MTTRSAAVPHGLRAIDLPVVIMIGAALNGLVVTVMQTVSAGGGLSLTLGLSPFQIIAILVAARLMLGMGEPDAAGPWWLDLTVAALILVPSSAVSWAALAIYSGYHAVETRAERRTGALLFLAIAVASLWSSVILKWFALPVTTGEAFVLGQIMHLIRPDIIQVANVIGNPDTHSLILMTRCTTADALPHAAIGVAAVAYLLGDVRPERLRQALVMLAVIYVAANLVRLGGLAWSAESYALVHGPIGANAFDLFQAGLVLTLGNWAGSS